MRVIALSTIREFWERHGDAEQPLRAWHAEVKRAKWNSPTDIKRAYRTASVLRGGRVVFNIGGNKYRLIVAINFPHQICYNKFVGTHKEHDLIDVFKVNQSRKGGGL